MSVPLDARPGVPGANPQPDQLELQTFEIVYADLDAYLLRQLQPPTHRYESADYLMYGGPELEFLVSIADLGIDELLEGTEIEFPLSKFRPPDSAFIRFLDNDQGRLLRFGFSFERGIHEPDESVGMEINLAQRDGTLYVYEADTILDMTLQTSEERKKTETVNLDPDKMSKLAKILDKYSSPELLLVKT